MIYNSIVEFTRNFNRKNRFNTSKFDLKETGELNFVKIKID